MQDTQREIEIEDINSTTNWTVATVLVTALVGTGGQPVPSNGALVYPESVAVEYTLNTRYDSWRVGAITISGRIIPVDADGNPDPTRTREEGQHAKVVLDESNMPGWLRKFATDHSPTSRLAIGVPGVAAEGNVPNVRSRARWAHDGRVFTSVTTVTSIKHEITGAYVHHAPVEVLPGDGSAPARRIEPDEVCITYQWGLHPNGARWAVESIEVIGRFVTPEGKPDLTEPWKACGHIEPPWAKAYAHKHQPLHVRLIDGESPSDIALRDFDTAAERHYRAAERRAQAEDSIFPTSDVNRLCEQEDTAAANASEAAQHLVEMLNQGAELPTAWADNPRPDRTRSPARSGHSRKDDFRVP